MFYDDGPYTISRFGHFAKEKNKSVKDSIFFKDDDFFSSQLTH